MTAAFHDRVVQRLAAGRSADGGFGPRPFTASEPEPTAVAALALQDAAAQRWLRQSQRRDGAVVMERAGVNNDSPTSVAMLAWGPGPERDRAADYLEHHLAPTVGSSPALPVQAASHGWAWVEGTYGWVEPTARAVLALRLAGRPSAAVTDGITMLVDRQCEKGGWNYGNRVVWGTMMEPYVQTTALGLLALQGTVASPSVEPALAWLEQRWDGEPGALSMALSLLALELHGRADAHRRELTARLADELDETGFFDDTTAMAWAAIATGDQWQQLRVPV